MAALVDERDPDARRVVQALTRRWPELQVASTDPTSVARWAGEGVAAVLVLAGQDSRADWVDALVDVSWRPWLLVPASRVGPDLFGRETLRRWVRLALPLRPPSIEHPRMAYYQGLASRHRLPSTHRVAQWQALGAAELTTELLRRTGRALDRGALVNDAQRLRDFDTGWLAPQTFSPNRRIGARGSYVMRLDRSVPLHWVGLD